MSKTYEVFDSSFEKIIDTSTKVSRLATGFTFTEGPIWYKNRLLFSDIPNNRIAEYNYCPEGPHVSTFRYPSGNANGMTIDMNGNLIVCEHSNRRVTSTDSNGIVKQLASSYEGKRLNSPNDAVVKSDGWIYFTDPPFGLTNRTVGKELPFNGVFRLSPDGDELSLIIDDMVGPNGLAFSEDESILYVADSDDRLIKKYYFNEDGSIKDGGVFANMNVDDDGVPDGIKVDTEGHLFSTGPKGIWVFDHDAKLLGKILVPETPANCGWGMAGNTLFITAQTSVYSVALNVTGIPFKQTLLI